MRESHPVDTLISAGETVRDARNQIGQVIASEENRLRGGAAIEKAVISALPTRLNEEPNGAGASGMPTKINAKRKAAREEVILEGNHPLNRLRFAQTELSILEKGLEDVEDRLPGIAAAHGKAVRQRVEHVLADMERCRDLVIPQLEKAFRDDRLAPDSREKAEGAAKNLARELDPVVKDPEFGRIAERYCVWLRADAEKQFRNIIQISPGLKRLYRRMDALMRELAEEGKDENRAEIEAHRENIALMAAAAGKIARGKPLFPHVEDLKENTERRWVLRLHKEQRSGREQAAALMQAGNALEKLEAVLQPLADDSETALDALEEVRGLMPTVRQKGFSKAVEACLAASHADRTAESGVNRAG